MVKSIVLGEAFSVLPETKLLKPVRNFLHRGHQGPVGDLTTAATPPKGGARRHACHSPVSYFLGARTRPVQAMTRSGTRTLPLVSGPKKVATAQAMQPIHVPMIIGSANPVPRRSANKVNTTGTKPPKIAPWW